MNRPTPAQRGPGKPAGYAGWRGDPAVQVPMVQRHSPCT